MSNALIIPHPGESITEARVKELIRTTPTPGSLVTKNIEYQYKYENFTNPIATSFTAQTMAATYYQSETKRTLSFPWQASARTDYVDTIDFDGASAVTINDVKLNFESWQVIDSISQSVATSSPLYRAVSYRISHNKGSQPNIQDASGYAYAASVGLTLYARFSISDGLVYITSNQGAQFHINVPTNLTLYGWSPETSASITVSIANGQYDLSTYLTLPIVHTWSIEAQY